MADFSLIKIDGELTKPATVLLEKVSAALGVIYEPTKIKRKARADVEAEKIKAIAKLEINDLEQRALSRFVKQEARKQKNIEEITTAAIKNLPNDAKVEGLEEDWIAHFFEQCENISDKEMQTVWTKLLTGEATKPGTFSKRTIDFISSIDKKDADLFTKFCKFVWEAKELCPFILDYKNPIYKKEGLAFQDLVHLDSIGLIKYDSIGNFGLNFDIANIENPGIIFYYGRALQIEFSSAGIQTINVGSALLTKTGMELASICGSEPNQEFYEYCVEKIFEQNLKIFSIPTAKGF